MENIGNDEAAKEAKILALAASLKDHREALHFIPEIFEQFTALQSNEYKATLIEKEKKDLKQKVESLLYDIEVKDKRIVHLKNELDATRFTNQQSFTGDRGSRPSSSLGKDAGNHSATFSNEYKATLLEKEKKDLEQKVESLLYDIDVKDKRIAALKKQLEATTFTNQQSFTGDRGSRPSSSLGKDADNHSATFRIMMLEKKLEAAKVDEERKRELISSLEGQLETMKSTRDLLEKRSPDTQAQESCIQAMKDRYEEMKHELNMKDQKLKEKEDKYDELSHVLNTKDQELKDEKDRFLLREMEYNSIMHNKDRDIEQTKLRYEELNRELNSKDQKLKEKNDKFQQLQKEYNSTIQNKDSDIERMKIRINELEQGANSALRCKDREIEQLKSRIASISEKKVRQDQSRVENTLSMNRQSKVEEDFKLFVDEARMDACDRIQSLCKSNEDSCVRIYYPRLACLIFEAAYEQTRQAKHVFGEICKDVSSCLIRSAPNLIHDFLSFRKKRYPSIPITLHVSTSRHEMEYPTDVVDAFLLSLKESATAHNVTFFVTDVQNSIRQKWHSWFQEDRWFKPDEKIIGDPQILSYIEKCIMLTWRMVTQVPAMALEYQSKYLESDFHTAIGHRSRPAMYNNTASEKQEIALYIWPGLRDGRGTVIRRGDVICKVAK